MNKSKVIKLDDSIKVSEEDKYYISEDWEADYEFLNKGDYEGLVKYREKIAKNYPDDVDSQWHLGEAYILNNEYKKVIEFLTDLHRKHPDHLDIQYSILDSLFSMDKSEKDFDWVRSPEVIRLSKDLLDYCYNLLKGKRKARELNDLFCELMTMGYLTFTEKDFLNYISTDERFEIKNDRNIQFSLVRVSKKLKKS